VTCTGCKQVIETLRAALEALAVVAPAWLGGQIPREWTSRYGQRGDDWRIPKAEQARAERAVAVGRDGLVLLEAVYALDAPAGLAGVEAVQVLRATWIQQFYLDGGQVRWRDKHSGLPPGSRMIPEPLRPRRPARRQTRPAPGVATRWNVGDLPGTAVATCSTAAVAGEPRRPAGADELKELEEVPWPS
jgi:hypothetical protein